MQLKQFVLYIIIGLLFSKILKPPRRTIQWIMSIIIWLLIFEYVDWAYIINRTLPNSEVAVELITFQPLSRLILGLGVGMFSGLLYKKHKSRLGRTSNG